MEMTKSVTFSFKLTKSELAKALGITDAFRVDSMDIKATSPGEVLIKFAAEEVQNEAQP